MQPHHGSNTHHKECFRLSAVSPKNQQEMHLPQCWRWGSPNSHPHHSHTIECALIVPCHAHAQTDDQASHARAGCACRWCASIQICSGNSLSWGCSLSRIIGDGKKGSHLIMHLTSQDPHATPMQPPRRCCLPAPPNGRHATPSHTRPCAPSAAVQHPAPSALKRHGGGRVWGQWSKSSLEYRTHRFTPRPPHSQPCSNPKPSHKCRGQAATASPPRALHRGQQRVQLRLLRSADTALLLLQNGQHAPDVRPAFMVHHT